MSEVKTEIQLRDEWMAEAKKITPETLPAFIEKLIKYPHDYGTICRAVAAGAIAGAYAVEHSPSGGITGFQGGCVMWDFISTWMSIDGPMRHIQYSDFLYPQYESKFQKTIDAETWKWIQEQAKERLAKETGDHINPAVIEHWKSIVDGKVPFGYMVANEH